MITLVCAGLGFLLALVWPLIDITSWRHSVNNIPEWFGFLVLFIIGCYGFWEIRLLLQAQDSKNPMADKRRGDFDE